MGYAVILGTGNAKAEVVKFGGDDFRTIQKIVGGPFDVVHCPINLKSVDGYAVDMFVDDEGLIRGLNPNPTASLLYGIADHGCAIVGRALCLKVNEKGESLPFDTEDQAREWLTRVLVFCCMEQFRLRKATFLEEETE